MNSKRYRMTLRASALTPKVKIYCFPQSLDYAAQRALQCQVTHLTHYGTGGTCGDKKKMLLGKMFRPEAVKVSTGNFRVSLGNSNLKSNKLYLQYLLYRNLNQKESGRTTTSVLNERFPTYTVGLKSIKKDNFENSKVKSFKEANSMRYAHTEHIQTKKLKNLLESKLGSQLSSNTFQNSKMNFRNLTSKVNTINLSEFFPYRKSFLCYWLLPFVGFVYTVSLQPTRVDGADAPKGLKSLTQGASLTADVVCAPSHTAPKRTTVGYGVNFLSEKSSTLVSSGIGFTVNIDRDIQNYCKLYLSSLDNHTRNNKGVSNFSTGQMTFVANLYDGQNYKLFRNDTIASPFFASTGISTQVKRLKFRFLNSLKFVTSTSVEYVVSTEGFKNLLRNFSTPMLLQQNVTKTTENAQFNKNFHLKLDILPNVFYKTQFKQNSNSLNVLGNNKGSLISFDLRMKNDFNPLISYLRASTLLDTFNKKQLLDFSRLSPKGLKASNTTEKNFQRNRSRLYEKFFTYNNIMDQMNSPILSSRFAEFAPGKEISELLLDSSTTLGVDQSNSSTKANSSLNEVKSTTGKENKYIKTSRDKLYKLLFNSLNFVNYSPDAPSGLKAPAANKNLLVDTANREMNFSSGLNSYEKEIYKYSHPLLMSLVSPSGVNVSTGLFHGTDGISSFDGQKAPYVAQTLKANQQSLKKTEVRILRNPSTKDFLNYEGIEDNLLQSNKYTEENLRENRSRKYTYEQTFQNGFMGKKVLETFNKRFDSTTTIGNEGYDAFGLTFKNEQHLVSHSPQVNQNHLRSLENNAFNKYSLSLKTYTSKIKDYLVLSRFSTSTVSLLSEFSEGKFTQSDKLENKVFLVSSPTAAEGGLTQAKWSTANEERVTKTGNKVEKLLRTYFSIKNSYKNMNVNAAKGAKESLKSNTVEFDSDQKRKMPKLRSKIEKLRIQLSQKLMTRISSSESVTLKTPLLNLNINKNLLKSTQSNFHVYYKGSVKSTKSILLSKATSMRLAHTTSMRESHTEEKFNITKTRTKLLTLAPQSSFLGQNGLSTNLQSPRLLVKNRLFINSVFDSFGGQVSKFEENLRDKFYKGLTSNTNEKKFKNYKYVSNYIKEYYKTKTPVVDSNFNVSPLGSTDTFAAELSELKGLKTSLLNSDHTEENLLRNFSNSLRKNAQKKRRIKKLKKETRQRKKRKRFYPRPVWIRYRMYSQLLKNRYYKSNMLRSKCKIDFVDLTQRSHFDARSAYNIVNFSSPNKNLHGLELQNLMQNTNTLRYNSGTTLYKKEWIPSSTNTTREFYTVSRPVLGELKRVLWKSYWLRSNLNPYLNKVKLYLKNIKQSKQSWEFYTNFHSFINYFLGFDARRAKPTNTDYSVSHYANPFVWAENTQTDTMNLAEYNRNSYERIQQFISQIRENLTLNGNVKVRASHVGYIPFKEKRGLTTKKNEDFWVKLGKALTLETHQSSVSQSTSKLRLYWAFSKTSSGFFKENHSRKERWATTKKREQTKNNKTKKIVRSLSSNVQFVVNERFPFLPEYLERKLFVLPEVQGTNALGTNPLVNRSVNFNKAISDVSGEAQPSRVETMNKLLQKALRKARQKEEKTAVFQNNNYFFNQKPPITFSTQAREGNKLDIFNVEGTLDKFRTNIFSSQNSASQMKSFGLREENLQSKFSKKKYIINKMLGYVQTPTNWNGFGDGDTITSRSSQRDNIKNHLTNKSSYWWTQPYSSFPADIVSFFQNFKQNVSIETSMLQSKCKIDFVDFTQRSHFDAQSAYTYSNTNYLISSVLFHFCAILSILSISQIRSFVKFSLLGISKIYKTSIGILLNFDFGKGTLSNFFEENVSNGSPVVRFALGKIDGVDFTQASAANSKSERSFPKENFFRLTASNKTQNLSDMYDLTKKSLSAGKTGLNLLTIMDLLASSLTFGNTKQKYVKLFTDTQSKGEGGKRNGTLAPENFQEFQAKGVLKTLLLKKQRTNSLKTNKATYTQSLNKNFLNFGDNTQKSVQPLQNSVMNSKLQNFYFFRYLTLMYNALTTKPAGSGNSIQRNRLDKNTQSSLSAQGNNPLKETLYTKLYLLVRYSIKKPLYYYKMAFQKPKVETVMNKTSKVTLLKATLSKTTLYSLLAMNILCENIYSIYNSSASILKEVKVNVFEKCLRSIYTFLEKPGEQIVDWVAYMFLVEWASDITNTIPENFDIYLGSTTSKLTRTLFFESLQFNQLLSNAFLLNWFANTKTVGNSSFFNTAGQFGLTNLASPFIQRRIYHLYEILLLQFYQPDTDLIIRQKKGILFWDIWGDFLMQTAEDSNINISELTSVKEEQIKLLEKCETSFPSVSLANASQIDFVLCASRIEAASPLPRSPKDLSPAQQTVVNPSPNKFVKLSQIFSGTHGTVNKKDTSVAAGAEGALLVGKNSKNKMFFNFLNVPFPVDSVKNSSQNFSFVHLKTGDLGDIRTGWGAQQFLSYQGKDTELFIDLHPRGCLSDIVSLIKSNESVQQPIGTLVCQIYSGLLSKQISKNILIVGSSGIEKTLLVQAIAGETELKIITDNAYRYAMVYRGVAVGIKLLRDVFDSLVATGPPCLFLIEDIHAIGEKRPLLISDDESLSKKDGTSQEIHEKNQVFYQLSKHVITHYKKPYKGDFSLLIPTNHFCFDLFLVRLNSQGSTSGKGTRSPQVSMARKNTVLPKISVVDGKKDNAESASTESNNMSTSVGTQKTPPGYGYKHLPSRLLIKSSELLAPPASSPFSFLTLKEEKKFKPLKTVSEMPWGWGGPHREQLAQVSKASYSIRVKVALLADMAISSLSVKLDMITDLLVIIDSVKGNRGFVIFATTHVPYVLDPALRRPGRLDETISLGLVPTLFSRWEILKSSFAALNPGIGPWPSHPNTLDYSYFNKNISNQYSISQIQTKIFNSISGKNTYKTKVKNNSFNSSQSLKQNSPVYTCAPNSLHVVKSLRINTSSSQTSDSNSLSNIKKFVESKLSTVDETNVQNSMTPNLLKHSMKKTARKILSQTYFSASVLLIQNNVCATRVDVAKDALRASSSTHDGRVSDLKAPPGPKPVTQSELQHTLQPKEVNHSNFFLSELTPNFFNENSRIINLYASPHQLKNHLIYLISGKLGEMFLFSKTDGRKLTQFKDLATVKNMILKKAGNTTIQGNYSSVYSSFGLSNTWQSLTSLVLSYIHKRYIYHKNLIVPKLLSFTNYSSLLEYPSPPATNILLPAKRYENYKRSFSFFALKRHTSISIMDKINLHQQQRLVKRLYRFPVQELFRSELMENRFTSFTNAGLMIGSYEPILQKPSSSNWFVKNRILMRHRNSLTNQWWNGQLPEHNAETTFLSDIDWRYTFISQSLQADNDGQKSKGVREANSKAAGLTDVKDILLDFPDTDQHYNPRNRRWLLTKGYYSNWFDFDKTIYSEIYSHFIFDSFVKAYHVFEKNREVLDFYSFYLLKNPTASNRTESILKLYQRMFIQHK